jgi:outer membrane protein assembly factor BamB
MGGIRWRTAVGLAATLGCLAASALPAAADNFPQEWPQFGSTGARVGVNPFEKSFTRQNIATLSQAWTGAYGSSTADESSPVIANGIAFIAGFDGRLSAFNLAGCFGARCDPLWTGQTGGDITAAPAVWQNEVLAASADHKLWAFPAGGCNFQPTCKPLWRGLLAGAVVDSSPAIANGIVYVGTYEPARLYAFKAGGCGHAFCKPLWTGTAAGHLVAPPGVGGGSVFIGSSNGTMYVFPAGGCGAATCAPTWTAALGGRDEQGGATIVGGTVYIESRRLLAFPTAGCGHPTCTPVWSGDLDGAGGIGTPAVSQGTVFVSSQSTPLPGSTVGVVQAFPAAGCGQALCKPTWTGVNFASGFESSPSIANGIVFVAKGPASGFPVDVGMYAFDAHGCGRLVCRPISFVQATIDGNYLGSTPAIADGMIVFGANDNATGQGTLYAFMP